MPDCPIPAPTAEQLTHGTSEVMVGRQVQIFSQILLAVLLSKLKRVCKSYGIQTITWKLNSGHPVFQDYGRFTMMKPVRFWMMQSLLARVTLAYD